MQIPFRRKQRRKSPLMYTVESIDSKVDTLISQVSQLAATRPAAAEKPAAPGQAQVLEVEPFTPFEPFSTESEAEA